MNKKIYSKILSDLKTLVDNLNAYNKVDATVTDDTLLKVDSIVNFANDVLEKGFVEDSCNEIEELLNKYKNMPN